MDNDLITVNAETTASATKQQILSMLQSLRVKRFHLHYHLIYKKGTIYTLLGSQLGPALRASSPGSPSDPSPSFRKAFPTVVDKGQIEGLGLGNGRRAIVGRAITIDRLSRMLGLVVGAPVVNKSGLNGLFDVDFLYDQPSGPSMPADFVTQVRKHLGLELKRGVGEKAVLVVDNIDGAPTPN